MESKFTQPFLAYIALTTLSTLSVVHAGQTESLASTDAAQVAAEDQTTAGQPPPKPAERLNVTGSPTLSELSRLQGEVLLAELRVKLQKAQSQLGVTVATSRTAVSATHPVIRFIGGPGTNLYAKLAFPGGTQIDARAGQQIPGCYTVEKITIDEVRLVDCSGARVVLATSSAPSAPPAPQATLDTPSTPARPIAGGPPQMTGVR
ncbi:type IV pilus biogenesis protein PilP [Achromobacter ruhlandii]|uniref:type IV pilus biogenesis protein PilP n=1 Tax=Achromobacter ruhlandii TaxID=72557 RepID=UPI003B9F4793